MLERCARGAGVDVQEDADAARQSAVHRGLLRADHRDVGPAKKPGAVGGKLGAEVRRGGEDGADDRPPLELVGVQDFVEQRLGRVANFLGGISRNGGGASQRTHDEHWRVDPVREGHGGTPDLTAALRLIAITDGLHDGVDGLVSRALGAVRGGATMLQVRLKDADARVTAEVTRRLVERAGVPVIVNDRLDVALVAGAAGVHVGADDLPVSAVRSLVPAGFIVGASVGSPAEASAAAGADYVGIGPFFASATKLDAGAAIGAEGFRALRALVDVPAVAIGGITAERARAAMDAGASGVAVIAALMGSADVAAAARILRAAVDA